MYAFLTLLSILIVLFVIVRTSGNEAFVGYVPLNTDSRAKLPDNIPPVVELPVAATYKASDLPGPLPTAPYQQIGSNLPSPYQDPSLIKTTRQRILNVLELLKGFLAFQATEIEDRSDPTIQLPLNTARSDFQRLQAEASVLQRNPGLTPQLTIMDIRQIEDNLAYLQKEVELIGSNRPFQGPQHDVDLEGFTDTNTNTATGPVASPAQPQHAPWPEAGSTLALQGVGFHYASRPLTPAIDQLSAQVHSGQTVAVVGPSGAGKTTLFDLLLRFHDPQQGQIEIDGVPIHRMALHDLRARIGIVPQEPVIFSGTAWDNIRYGRPEASDAEVIAAAQAAYAHEFLSELPEGYDSFLGERGVRLSGGQRQRLAIARAILKNPPLLLLDEATSALDAQSERMVQAALERAMTNRTTLVIAHRLATVQKADVIWVLDRGRLIEQGTHAQLIAQGGLYASLAALQFQSS
jgi:ABC-type multidrug transport system fused ATPase/permease subunit